MPANLENQQCPQMENVSFHSNPKERQHQRIFKLMYNCTSHASKVILKILQARLQQSVNQEIPDVQARYRKGRGTRDQIAWIPWIIHRKGKGIKKKKTTSTSLTMLNPLTAWVKTKWKILQEMRIPDHLTCLLRNLYAGQEATLRLRHGTMD